MSPRRRGGRRRSPELQAGLDALKSDLARELARGRRAGPAGTEGPMVSRLLDLAERHVAQGRRRPDPDGDKDRGRT